MSQRIEHPSLETPPAGSIRFNTDSSKMEIYNGEQWWEIDATSPELQTGGTRAIKFGGITSTYSLIDVIEFFNVDTTGDATDFGNLVRTNRGSGSASDRTRAVNMGGSTPNVPAGDPNIEKITVASTGDATDFGGDLLTGVRGNDAVNDRTRAVSISGEASAGENIMQYITIQSSGGAVDFGDLQNASSSVQKMSSPTRGLVTGRAGGTEIEYIIISTLGDAADFGDITVRRRNSGATSNAVRGIVFGGFQPSPSADHQSMEFVTLATLGNGTDFGDLANSQNREHCAAASKTRAVKIGGRTSAPTAYNNAIEYVQFASLGDAIDFGDIPTNNRALTATSNGHGGLG